MQTQSTTRPPSSVVREGSRDEHVEYYEDPSFLPRFRRTFNHFSRQGVRTRGGGVVSGELRIQVRKGLLNRTRVMVSYVNHRVFVEVEGSPLEGDVRPGDIFNRLRRFGMVGVPQK